MTNPDVMLEPDQPELKFFKKMNAYISTVTTGKTAKAKIFQLALKASLSKCYEFNIMVREPRSESDAFFWIPSMRGICEDLIVLNYVKSIESKQRNQLMRLLMAHDLETRIDRQAEFFKVARPQQRVLRLKDPKARIQKLEADIQNIWNANGWKNLKTGSMPQIRQIAEKQSSKILQQLYDYLYRMTSGMVHFSMQTLLRTGWGEMKGKVLEECKFSTKHFSHYYKEIAEVYGAFMFCLYFEFFSMFLRPGREDKMNVDAIRKSILGTLRWPEMVTFEEMNIERPKSGIFEILVTTKFSVENKKLLT